MRDTPVRVQNRQTQCNRALGNVVLDGGIRKLGNPFVGLRLAQHRTSGRFRLLRPRIHDREKGNLRQGLRHLRAAEVQGRLVVDRPLERIARRGRGERNLRVVHFHAHHAVRRQLAVWNILVETQYAAGVPRPQGGHAVRQEKREATIHRPAGGVPLVLVGERERGDRLRPARRLQQLIHRETVCNRRRDLARIRSFRRRRGRCRITFREPQHDLFVVDRIARQIHLARHGHHLEAANHRRALDRRDGERRRDAIRVEIVAQRGKAHKTEVRVPDAAIVVPEERVQTVGYVARGEIEGLGVAVPGSRVRVVRLVDVVRREPAVRHEGHEERIPLAILLVHRQLPVALQIFVEPALERTVLERTAGIRPQREGEVRDRGQRRQIRIEGDVQIAVDFPRLRRALQQFVPVLPFLDLVEQVGERDAGIRGGGARLAGEQAVDVEVVRHVQREIGVASGVEVERLPLGGRRAASVIPRLAHQGRRHVGEPFQRQDGHRVAGIDRAVGDISRLARARHVRIHEDAPDPAVAIRVGARTRLLPEPRVGVVVDGVVDVVDRPGEGRLHKFARRRRAAQIVGRQTRPAHVRREGDGRDGHERQHAQNDQKRGTAPRGNLSHLRSSSERRYMLGTLKLVCMPPVALLIVDAAEPCVMRTR